MPTTHSLYHYTPYSSYPTTPSIPTSSTLYHHSSNSIYHTTTSLNPPYPTNFLNLHSLSLYHSIYPSNLYSLSLISPSYPPSLPSFSPNPSTSLSHHSIPIFSSDLSPSILPTLLSSFSYHQYSYHSLIHSLTLHSLLSTRSPYLSVSLFLAPSSPSPIHVLSLYLPPLSSVPLSTPLSICTNPSNTLLSLSNYHSFIIIFKSKTHSYHNNPIK